MIRGDPPKDTTIAVSPFLCAAHARVGDAVQGCGLYDWTGAPTSVALCWFLSWVLCVALCNHRGPMVIRQTGSMLVLKYTQLVPEPACLLWPVAVHAAPGASCQDCFEHRSAGACWRLPEMVGPAWLACGSKLGTAVILRLRRASCTALAVRRCPNRTGQHPRVCADHVCSSSAAVYRAVRVTLGIIKLPLCVCAASTPTAGRSVILHVHTGLV